MDKQHNTDTHQVQEGGAIGYSKEYLSGLSKVFDEGYKRFRNKKVNIYSNIDEMISGTLKEDERK